MENKVSVKKNFIMNVILTLSGIIFPIISFPYVSTILGPGGTGKVDFATSVIGYFALVAQLGIPYYGLRACAKHRDNKIELSRTVHELMVINLVMTVLAYLFLIPTLLYVPKCADKKVLILIISSTLFLNAIGIEYLYKGIEKYSYITIRSTIFKFIAFVAMFILVKDKGDYVIYGAITILASSASNIMNFFHARKYIQFTRFGKPNYSQHFKPIAVFFAMSCATTIYLNLDRLMLGFIIDDVAVGYYGAAIKIKNILVSLVTSLGAVLLPRASYCIETGQMYEFRRLTNKALHFVFVVSTPLSLFFVYNAKEGLLVASAPEYLPGLHSMMFIMPTVLFIGITNILGIQILLPLGKEKYVLYSEIGGAVVDLALNAVLIPKYGATGASVGTLVAEFTVLIIQIYLMKNVKDQIHIFNVFKRISYWKMAVAIVIGFACSFWVKLITLPIENPVGRLHNFVRVAIAGSCFFIAYGIVMLILKDSMVIEMKDFVFSIPRKLLKRKTPSKN